MLTDEARDVSTPTAGGPDPESRDEFTSITQYLTGDEKKDSGSNTGWEYYRDSGNGAEWKKIQPDAIARTGETGRLINNPARPGKIGTRIMFDQSPEVESELMIVQDEPASVIRQCWLRLADDVADGEHQKEVPPTQAKAPRIAIDLCDTWLLLGHGQHRQVGCFQCYANQVMKTPFTSFRVPGVAVNHLTHPLRSTLTQLGPKICFDESSAQSA